MARIKLVALRNQAGMTQQQVANKIGITRSFYGMIETGDRNPTLELARKISKLFNVDIEEVFFEKECHESLPPTGTGGD